MSSGSVYITPLLIKSDIDPADVRSHRAISNLSVVFKLLVRLQPAFRAGYSIETAVLKIFLEILLSVKAGDLMSALVLRDLSATFDTMDHDILIR